MENRAKYNLPIDFNSDLLNKSIPLDTIGINELGWRFQDIKDVIEFFADKDYAILGGDIYIEREGRIQSTFDNWYLNRDNREWHDFVMKSKQKSIDYLQNYSERNKNNLESFIIVLVYESI